MTLGAPGPPTVVCRLGTATCPIVYARCLPSVRPTTSTRSPSRHPQPRSGRPKMARAVLEEAALSRRSARRLWQLMGLRLGPPPYSADHVQGWAITDTGANWVRLETESWYLSAQAVCLVDDVEVSLSLSLRHDRKPVGRFVWALVQGPHQRAVPTMLRQAVALVVDSLAESDRTPGPLA